MSGPAQPDPTSPTPSSSQGSSGSSQQRQNPHYAELAASDDFQELRRRYRAFVFPWTVAFLVWYLLYVSLSNWAPDLMGTEVVGNVNLGLVLGLLQFVTTFGIAYLYARYAAKHFDPLADRVRARYDEVPR